MGKLRVINGLGQKQQEPLASRDAVARCLMEAGADMLLHRISTDRAEEIERRGNDILDLFDRVDQNALFLPVLQRHLDDLEQLMRDTRQNRVRRARVSR